MRMLVMPASTGHRNAGRHNPGQALDRNVNVGGQGAPPLTLSSSAVTTNSRLNGYSEWHQ